MSKERKATSLTVYLAKPEYTQISDVLREDANYKEYTAAVGAESSASLLIAPSYSKPPPWAAFFADIVSAEEIGVNQATGAVLALTHDERLFLYSFGQGRHLISSETIELNFGLRCA